MCRLIFIKMLYFNNTLINALVLKRNGKCCESKASLFHIDNLVFLDVIQTLNLNQEFHLVFISKGGKVIDISCLNQMKNYPKK
jgi:hypothetical protein